MWTRNANRPFPQKITQITWATPEWKALTNKDGTGLYHELINEIYGRAGIRVVVEYVPWVRAMDIVKKGEADFSGGDSPSEDYAQPKIPIIRNTELVFFKKSTYPSYKGVENLDNKSGVWIRGYVDNFPKEIKSHLKGTENTTRTGALQMVLADRADYYLDNDFQMDQTLKEFEGKYAASEYATGTVYAENLFLCFTKTPRGQRLADIFDQGMKSLAASGKLNRIYTKWVRTAPLVP